MIGELATSERASSASLPPAAAAELAHEAQAGLLLGQARLRGDDLAVELGELLVAERHALGVEQVVLGPELGHRLLGLPHLVLERGDPLLEPAGGLAGRRQLARQLVGDVELGDPVGDLRRP
jgi:hypothetical protein